MQESEQPKKVVVITGAASGIGASIGETFSNEGYEVFGLDINNFKFKDPFKKIIKTDVTDPSSIKSAVDKIVDDTGRIDVLVNAAGVMQRATVLETSEQDWDRIIDVNLKGVFLISKHVIPIMQKAKFGRIINIASGWGIVGGNQAAAYSASKGGVILLTKSMAIDHGADGITVNAICPGDTETPMLSLEEKQLNLTAGSLKSAAKNRPLGRVGQPDDIAGSALFFATKEASFITGVALPVDGGGLAGG